MKIKLGSVQKRNHQWARKASNALVELITKSDALQASWHNLAVNGKVEIPSKSKTLQASWQRPIEHRQVEIASKNKASQALVQIDSGRISHNEIY